MNKKTVKMFIGCLTCDMEGMVEVTYTKPFTNRTVENQYLPVLCDVCFIKTQGETE